MLTRLKVSGFKNLVDVDVRFGPFTCVAGPNGVGKSNLFDAIRFLSALADRPLIEAALSVRESRNRTADVRSLFHRVGDTYAKEMSFEAEMIVPQKAWDDLGQEAKARITFLRYSLTLAYREGESRLSQGSLELLKEQLVHINIGEAGKHLVFPHSVKSWRGSAVVGRRAGKEFISTEREGEKLSIRRHQDGSGGIPLARPAKDLPRTVLSVSNASESPTALVARREMQSWRLLQLEPSALRQPDNFEASTRLGADGSHLAATLYRLARSIEGSGNNSKTQEENSGKIYAQVANRLAGLIDDVDELSVERDEKRELLTLYVKNKDKTSHPARALSDGTLRFLALAVLELDPEAQGLLCLEEPENGIHPERIPAMLKLLQDIATDVNEPIGPDNPLRQVIINTHSPAVVLQVPEDSLLIAEVKEAKHSSGWRYKRACFSCLRDTWRVKGPEGINTVSKGKLLAYLNPILPEEPEPNVSRRKNGPTKTRRVVDRSDLQILIPFSPP